MLKSPSRRAALAGLLLLAGPAAAQTVPPVAAKPIPAPSASPSPPALAKTAPVVDPQVTELFKQAIAAHGALTALTETITVTSLEKGRNVTRTVTLAYRKPHSAKLTISDSAGAGEQIFGSSTAITIYPSKSKTYQVQPIASGTDTISRVLSRSRSLLLFLATNPESLPSLLTQPGVSAQLGPVTSDAFGPADTVVAVLPVSKVAKATFTFSFGKTDHLLHQFAEKSDVTPQGERQKVELLETVTALSTTPTLTAADFVFTPPAGVKKIALPKAAEAPPMHDPRLTVGAKPFAVTAKDLSSKPLTLAQYKGKVVLMDFWATWCGPCVGEMPNVQAAYKKYHAQGFDIVGVSLDQSRPALMGFIAENKLPWRQVFDGKGWDSAVPHEYGVHSIPFGLLIGRDGKIAAVDVRGLALATAIEQALAK